MKSTATLHLSSFNRIPSPYECDRVAGKENKPYKEEPRPFSQKALEISVLGACRGPHTVPATSGFGNAALGFTHMAAWAPGPVCDACFPDVGAIQGFNEGVSEGTGLKPHYVPREWVKTNSKWQVVSRYRISVLESEKVLEICCTVMSV